MEKQIYAEIDALFGYSVVAKGLNGVERARIIRSHWTDLPNCVAVGIDASRFDQRTGRGALRYEHGVYLRHTPTKHRKKVARLLRMQLTTYGRIYTCEGVIKYKVPGGRCSGDINTSLGNVIIMTHLVYDYLKTLKCDTRFINDGDDGVIFISKDNLDKLEGLFDWFIEYGYHMTIETPVDVMEQLEFCQCQPVYDGNEWIMCRKPSVVYGRDSFTTKSVATKGQWDYYRGAISNSGLACMGGMPVIDAFYRALGRGSKTQARINEWSSGLYWQSIGLNRKGLPVSSAARVSFYRAFGIVPDTQVHIEKLMQGYTPCYQQQEPVVYNRVFTNLSTVL